MRAKRRSAPNVRISDGRCSQRLIGATLALVCGGCRSREVLARGPIRRDLQAHFAVARVAEQPRAAKPASLLRWTESGGPGELRPRAPTDPGVTVSRHRALLTSY